MLSGRLAFLPKKQLQGNVTRAALNLPLSFTAIHHWLLLCRGVSGLWLRSLQER